MTPVARIKTGDTELDSVLGGGFPANSINILMGEPGSGKTVLVERLIFANANDARPILYLTTLSEPLDKVVRYLQQFEFFDEAKLLGQVVYESMGDELAEEGVSVLVPKLKEAIRTLTPKIIVIDSFKAIHDLSTSIPEMRRLLYEMASLLTAYETTAFLVGEYDDSHIAMYPEFAVADGIVELLRAKTAMRDERFLRVLKLRGSFYLEGLHGCRITTKGLEVFTRLVGPKDAPAYESVVQRVTTGVEGLDAILGGGFWRGSSVIVAGPTGSGKTTVGLQFALEGVRRGEPAVYVNFQENPTQLAQQMQSLSVPRAEREKLFTIYVSPVEMQIDRIIAEVFNMVDRCKLQRVVIDSLGDLSASAADPQRLLNYLYALSQHFAARRVTTLMTYEVASSAIGADRVHVERFSAQCDAFILLDVDISARARRTLRVIKARSIAHDLEAHDLSITSTGVNVAP